MCWLIFAFTLCKLRNFATMKSQRAPSREARTHTRSQSWPRSRLFVLRYRLGLFAQSLCQLCFQPSFSDSYRSGECEMISRRADCPLAPPRAFTVGRNWHLADAPLHRGDPGKNRLRDGTSKAHILSFNHELSQRSNRFVLFFTSNSARQSWT